ncbi:MAG: hypothetical protein ABL999_19015 [Pyrinomonadaceae bacterium]
MNIKFLLLVPIFIILLGIGAYIRLILSIPTAEEMDVTHEIHEVLDCTELKSFPGVSDKLSGITNASLGYFRESDFPAKFDGRGSWYGKHLTAMDEPSLIADRDLESEVYRFLWLRTFDHPMAIRIVRSSDVVTLTVVEMTGAGGYEPGSILLKKTKIIEGDHWCVFQKKLETADYWNLGADKRLSGNDGAQWVLEGVRAGRYHMVDRWSPEETNFRDACLYLLELSGVDPKTSGRGLY